MKKLLSVCLAWLCVLASCTSSGRVAGDPTAVMLGANIGGIAGSLIGASNSHTYRGELIGSLVGTIAGAAIASAITTPQNSNNDEGYVDTRSYRSPNLHPDNSYANDYGYNRMESRDLVVRNIRFIDDTRDHVIQSGECAKIIFEVVNCGSSDIYGVTPVVTENNGVKRLYISPSVTMECIRAGDGIRYTANIRAGKLRNGEALFRITALDSQGAMAPAREFSIPVVQRAPGMNR